MQQVAGSGGKLHNLLLLLLLLLAALCCGQFVYSLPFPFLPMRKMSEKRECARAKIVWEFSKKRNDWLIDWLTDWLMANWVNDVWWVTCCLLGGHSSLSYVHLYLSSSSSVTLLTSSTTLLLIFYYSSTSTSSIPSLYFYCNTSCHEKFYFSS